MAAAFRQTTSRLPRAWKTSGRRQPPPLPDVARSFVNTALPLPLASQNAGRTWRGGGGNGDAAAAFSGRAGRNDAAGASSCPTHAHTRTPHAAPVLCAPALPGWFLPYHRPCLIVSLSVPALLPVNSGADTGTVAWLACADAPRRWCSGRACARCSLACAVPRACPHDAARAPRATTYTVFTAPLPFAQSARLCRTLPAQYHTLVHCLHHSTCVLSPPTTASAIPPPLPPMPSSTMCLHARHYTHHGSTLPPTSSVSCVPPYRGIL